MNNLKMRSKYPRFLLVASSWMPRSWLTLIFGLFLIVGVVVLDDYGISIDEAAQRSIGVATVDYIMQNNDNLLQKWERHYGVAFELSLVFFERILGLEDSRSIYLSRHLVTHLFFLVGGFICYFLAYGLFQNRLLALFAMLLFLLHPHMYAHSFFNTKDIPFLSMFMIALFLINRGFRKDTIGVFLLCGMVIGILTNIRIMGIMLFAAVLAMRVCDFVYASGREEKKHILITSGGFGLVAVLTLYVTWPYIWSDPIRHLIEAFTTMAHFPNNPDELFQGEKLFTKNPPFHYVPTYISITTPPVTLLLGVIGIVSIFGRGFVRPGDIFRNTPLRFEFLLVACFMLPILAVVLMRSTLYNGWRQMYFLYAPFCVLAIFGLHGLVSYSKRIRFGKWVVYGLVGAGVGATVVSMTLIHPLQHLYFNFLVDRTTPENLIRTYYFNHWGTANRIALKYLTEQYPSSSIYINSGHFRIMNNLAIFSKEDRERIFIGISPDRKSANFSLFDWPQQMKEIDSFIPSLIYKHKIYNNTILYVTKMISINKDTAYARRKTYRTIAPGRLVFSSNFEIYFSEDDRTLIYEKKSCSGKDTIPVFLLHVLPTYSNDLPDEFKQYGYGSYDFFFNEKGIILDGKCVAMVKLPKYEIASIVTGQYFLLTGIGVWKGQFPLSK